MAGAGLAIVLAGVLAAAAPARTAADDVSVLVTLGISGGRSLERKTGPNFSIVVGVESVSGARQTVTVSTRLPDGLRWGADGPDAADGCTGTAPVRCTGRTEPGFVGTVGVGWFWDVVAERPGTYEITASVDPTEPDPDTSNNTHTFRFEVVRPPAVTVRASAGAVRLAPAKPRAGSPVSASVRVSAGGAPIRPGRVACAATIAGARIAGTGTAAIGRASCRFRTPKSAKGKMLRGSVSFRARGSRFTKRFSVRLS